mmetsp:Transcript_49012/g.59324  ORF Transcript_49012/g.59324 Transcript_49012/m.59324 type:complete len:327 (+) Transcript_49012:30-1010(+)
MSAGYASRLSEYPNKGVCGLPETIDSERSIARKIDRLANLVKCSKYIVVLTGAGISTSAGIPDFRGPKGIWTLEKKQNKPGKKQKTDHAVTESKNANSSMISSVGINREPSSSLRNGTIKQSSQRKRNSNSISDTEVKPPSFSNAQPTYTHYALTKLASKGIIKYCITQNVDGLHRRSGLPREKQSILHGCVFTEKCETCGKEYFRDHDVGGVGCQKTGGKCEDEGCRGPLRDTVLDWEDELPEPDYGLAENHCEKADLVISLGTSLRIEPAGSLPLLARKFVIVNLQKTPKDNHASLLLRAKVDYVMKGLLERLDLCDGDFVLDD